MRGGKLPARRWYQGIKLTDTPTPATLVGAGATTGVGLHSPGAGMDASVDKHELHNDIPKLELEEAFKIILEHSFLHPSCKIKAKECTQDL